ncbi:hypothetical protein RR48_11886 [Papilio machaon]|uniref:Uncharacterized protein n=1 Tax=Papilio machaon TaxID=76193 RepID=A0A194RJN2_PAPMA|nr:hypothetical protein RR48_11886 [Papilio machaon]
MSAYKLSHNSKIKGRELWWHEYRRRKFLQRRKINIEMALRNIFKQCFLEYMRNSSVAGLWQMTNPKTTFTQSFKTNVSGNLTYSRVRQLGRLLDYSYHDRVKSFLDPYLERYNGVKFAPKIVSIMKNILIFDPTHYADTNSGRVSQRLAQPSQSVHLGLRSTKQIATPEVRKYSVETMSLHRVLVILQCSVSEKLLLLYPMRTKFTQGLDREFQDSLYCEECYPDCEFTRHDIKSSKINHQQEYIKRFRLYE